MTFSRAGRCSLALLAVLMPLRLRAQGFGLNEIGACATARASAVAASGCKDASTIYWNPAATVNLSGWSFLLGAQDFAVNGKFERDTSHQVYKTDIPNVIAPSAFVSYHAPNSKLAWGIGAYVPYGLTMQWPLSFPGKFEAEKASIQTIYIQPNVGWRINDTWAVGGGPIIGRSSVELRQALDLSAQTVTGTAFTFGQLGIPLRTEFADALLKGDAWGFGAQVGITGHMSPNWTIGLRALAPIEFSYNNATATFTQVQTGLVLAANNPLMLPPGTPLDAVLAPQFTAGGALEKQPVTAKITHPAQVQAGIDYTGFRGWDLEADYHWVGWQQFKSLPLTFPNHIQLSRTLIEDYNNSSALRLGAEHTWHDVRIRAGYSATASAAPPETVTPLLPEQDREAGTFGLGVPLGHIWALDAAYSHIFTQGARGRIVERTQESQTAAQLNSGVYSLYANIISLSLKASF